MHTCIRARAVLCIWRVWSGASTDHSGMSVSCAQDTDEEFVETLKTVNECIPVVEACSRDFNHMATAWQSEARTTSLVIHTPPPSAAAACVLCRGGLC